MISPKLIDWLLSGDVAIQYQVHRDLLHTDRKDLQQRISNEGWGNQYLENRKDDGHWGLSFYQPKWTSTHYTLLDLKNLQFPVNEARVLASVMNIIQNEKGLDGGINPSGTINQSDACINGMVLNYCSYFQVPQDDLISVIDFILSQQLADGGFNCRLNRSGARHSSLHTTLSILEGFLEYRLNHYTYKLEEVIKAETKCREFILDHKLFRSDKTGEIIDRRFLALPFPGRWRYDILRCLEYFVQARCKYDDRMQDAIDLIKNKRQKDGTWKLNAHHTGKQHFKMEEAGKPSRWNTLRALKVLKHFNQL